VGEGSSVDVLREDYTPVMTQDAIPIEI